jgi:hypothetical protein
MNKSSNWRQEAFDILFIMILCFATLLSAMLIKGNSPLQMEYVLKPATFIITVGSIGTYIWYVSRESEKGLRIMIQKIYKTK